MDDTDFVIASIHAIWKKYSQTMADMPEPVRVFWLVQYFKACVDNGGFAGFLINPSGDEANATISALQSLGAHNCRELLLTACSVFPDGVAPVELMERERVVYDNEDLDALWDPLDEEFYKDPDELDALLRRWILTHPDDFPPIDECVA